MVGYYLIISHNKQSFEAAVVDPIRGHIKIYDRGLIALRIGDSNTTPPKSNITALIGIVSDNLSKMRRVASQVLTCNRGMTRGFCVNPMFDLSGKKALVTGGGRDIGRSCAVELARAGADVVVNYHSSREAAEDTVAEIESLGRSATAVQADVFTASGVETLAEAAFEFHGGRVDLLVCNAGGLNQRGD